MRKPIAKILALVAFAAGALSFGSCDLFEKADDVTFEEELVINWDTDENLEGSNVPYEDFQILDLADYPVFAPYIDKIKSVEVTKITYRITNFDNSPHNQPVTLVGGTASFGPYDSSSPSVTVPMAGASGVNIGAQTAETTLAIDAAGLSKVAKDLLDDKQVKMYSEGTLSKTPVAFRVVSTFYVKITANALD
ncbi:MAG TPA: hypothetical protein VGD65_06075 [Chryseosolibacter sp.]